MKEKNTFIKAYNEAWTATRELFLDELGDNVEDDRLHKHFITVNDDKIFFVDKVVEYDNSRYLILREVSTGKSEII